MRTILLGLLFCWALAFVLAVDLEPRYRSSLIQAGRPNDAFSVILGDSRRLFAKHMYAKADAYFHSGYYPSIFDHRSKQSHLSATTAEEHGAPEEEGDWLGPPKDWLDRFGRYFYPTEHRHLGEDPEDSHPPDHPGPDLEHGHDHDHGELGSHSEKVSSKELLPWLQLAATLDPQRPQTYVVASFWLRSELGKVTEAEQFLRQGLRANPGDPEMLFELGRIYRENHQDNDRARNIWEAALAKWRESSPEQRSENPLLSAQLLGNLAQLEEATGHLDKALEYLSQLHEFSPNRASIEQWMAQIISRQETSAPRP